MRRLALLTASSGVRRRGADAAPQRPAGAGDGVSPGEIQRLFDAYVVMQAQQELQLSDEQYPKFLTKVKALQAVRQKGQIERGRIIQELRRLDAAPSLDERGSPATR